MTELHVGTKEIKRVVLIELSGRVDSTTASKLGEALSGAIDDGKSRLVLDLTAVEYMSSAGLREIVAALKRVQNLAGTGDLRLASPSDRVREVLELAGLDEIFKIYDSQIDAVGSFT